MFFVLVAGDVLAASGALQIFTIAEEVVLDVLAELGQTTLIFVLAQHLLADLRHQVGHNYLGCQVYMTIHAVVHPGSEMLDVFRDLVFSFRLMIELPCPYHLRSLVMLFLGPSNAVQIVVVRPSAF